MLEYMKKYGKRDDPRDELYFSMEMKIDFFEILLAICSTEITTKFQNMAKNQPTIDAFMDRRRSSEHHFLSKLYNKLLHRPTNDAVNFRGRGWVECACIRWERSRKRTNHESWFVRAS